MSNKTKHTFEEVTNEINSRLDGLGQDKESYGDRFLHTKLDLILYVMVDKGLVKLEQLTGDKSKDPEKGGAMEGGYIETVVKCLKEYANRKR